MAWGAPGSGEACFAGLKIYDQLTIGFRPQFHAYGSTFSVVAEFGCVIGWGQFLFLGINLVAWLLFFVVASSCGTGGRDWRYRVVVSMGGRLRGSAGDMAAFSYSRR